MTFVATARAAALLGGRDDLPYRLSAGGATDAAERPLIVLATLRDDFSAAPASDEARLAVIDDGSAPLDDPRFDDYVFPSASRSEVIFRALRVLLRKTPAPIRLDPMSLEVHGRVVPLSVTEHRLLGRLLERVGAPVARAELLRILGESAGDDSRALDAHIYRLRRKLCAIPGVHLETLRQRGFSLRVEDPPRIAEPRPA